MIFTNTVYERRNENRKYSVVPISLLHNLNDVFVLHDVVHTDSLR